MYVNDNMRMGKRMKTLMLTLMRMRMLTLTLTL